MTTKQNKDTFDPEAILSEAEARPAAELQALHVFLADCNRRKADPDPATSIRGEIEGKEAALRIAEFGSWSIHDRAVHLADECVSDRLDEFVAFLRETLAAKTKPKDGIFQSIGEKGAALTRAMFSPGMDRDKLAAEREKAEDEAAVLESDIAAAVQAIRMLEVAPSLATYRTAEGTVSRISLPR
jgi:hypothetical protein